MNLPTPVEVGLDEWGRPTMVVVVDENETAGAVDDGKGGTAGVAGRVVEEVVEEWVVVDEWWRVPIHRRYVEVVLAGGAHVVLYENQLTGEWFLQRP